MGDTVYPEEVCIITGLSSGIAVLIMPRMIVITVMLEKVELGFHFTVGHS